MKHEIQHEIEHDVKLPSQHHQENAWSSSPKRSLARHDWYASGELEEVHVATTAEQNEHRRRPGGPPILPISKSRLVVRGDLEQVSGICTDSPTCELEGLRLIISWAAGDMC